MFTVNKILKVINTFYTFLDKQMSYDVLFCIAFFKDIDLT